MQPVNQQPLNNQRIGQTLTAAFAIVSVLPLIILLVVVVQQLQRQSLNQIIAQQESLATVKINDLRRWLHNGETILGLVTSPEDIYDRVVTILISDRPLTTAVTLQTRHLQQQVEAQDIFTELFIFNQSGTVRASSNTQEQGKVVVFEPNFENILPETATITIPPYYDPIHNSVQMFMVLPIYDKNGQLAGGMGGRLNIQILSNIMTTRVGFDTTSETLLVNENSKLVTPSRFDEFPIGSLLSGEVIDRALNQQDGAGVYESYHGAQVISVYQWLPDLNTALLSQVDIDEAFKPLVNARNIVLISGLVVALGAFVIGSIITNWITAPIRHLTTITSRVVAGDYSQRANVTQRNEIGQLASGFNQMTEKLISTISNLDEQVQQLAVANERAKEAVRLKDEFLAVMSHELRTPLNASIGFLGLLKMSGRLSNADLQMVARARANNERLLELINNILDISRIEAGRMKLIVEPLDIYRLIHQIYDETVVLAHQKGLQFNMHISDDMPTVFHADDDAMRKIITNLLSNAIKFTESGSVQLDAQYKDNILILVIKDTGIGVPSHLQQIIFESFRQADTSARRAHGGSGLGLAIVQSLVRSMNGQISLDSQVNKGSTFTIRLPNQQIEGTHHDD